MLSSLRFSSAFSFFFRFSKLRVGFELNNLALGPKIRLLPKSRREKPDLSPPALPNTTFAFKIDFLTYTPDFAD